MNKRTYMAMVRADRTVFTQLLANVFLAKPKEWIGVNILLREVGATNVTHYLAALRNVRGMIIENKVWVEKEGNVSHCRSAYRYLPDGQEHLRAGPPKDMKP